METPIMSILFIGNSFSLFLFFEKSRVWWWGFVVCFKSWHHALLQATVCQCPGLPREIHFGLHRHGNSFLSVTYFSACCAQHRMGMRIPLMALSVWGAQPLKLFGLWHVSSLDCLPCNTHSIYYSANS